DGIDRPKLVHWFAAYDLVSTYLAPHPGSRWAKGPDALDLTLPPRKLVDDVLPDPDDGPAPVSSSSAAAAVSFISSRKRLEAAA
ncbi:hypothetical protein ADL27_45740, partial [Streptomyces sp. NRRL F-6602]